jgi:hypothetical protein
VSTPDRTVSTAHPRPLPELLGQLAGCALPPAGLRRVLRALRRCAEEAQGQPPASGRQVIAGLVGPSWRSWGAP